MGGLERAEVPIQWHFIASLPKPAADPNMCSSAEDGAIKTRLQQFHALPARPVNRQLQISRDDCPALYGSFPEGRLLQD